MILGFNQWYLITAAAILAGVWWWYAWPAIEIKGRQIFIRWTHKGHRKQKTIKF